MLDGRQKIVDFDEILAEKIEALQVLNQVDFKITYDVQRTLDGEFVAYRSLVGAGDPDAIRWGQLLSDAGKEISQLRDSLNALYAGSDETENLPAQPAIDRAQREFTYFVGMVGEEDGDVKRMRAAAKATADRIATLKERLEQVEADVGEDGLANQVQIAAALPLLNRLSLLAGSDDVVVGRVRALIDRSQGKQEQWLDRTRLAAGSEPLTLVNNKTTKDLLAQIEAKEQLMAAHSRHGMIVST